MAKREQYVFLCNNQRPPGHPRGCCRDRNSIPIWERFAELLEKKGLDEKVRIVGTTCLGPCEAGAVVAIYPDDVWYGRLNVEDVEEIVESHLLGGKPVERLVLKPADFE
jgi:(2Fe-2S) ferredoxin